MPAAPVRSTRPRRSVVAAALLLSLAAIAIAAACWAGRAPRSTGSLTPAEARAKAGMSPATSGLFIADGVRLPFLREGRGDVVVMLPDSVEGLDAWRSQVAALGQRFLAVAYLRREPVAEPPAPDVALPGASDAVLSTVTAADRGNPAAPSTPDARHLRDCLLLSSSLATSPVHLVGEGDGARLALRFALEYPDRVRSLVLSAPDPRWFASDTEVQAARNGTRIRASADTTLACRRLWRLRVPVLVISGERDWRTFGDTPPLRCVRVVREQVLRGAGMKPHLQMAEDFNGVVARFIERQRLTAGEP